MRQMKLSGRRKTQFVKTTDSKQNRKVFQTSLPKISELTYSILYGLLILHMCNSDLVTSAIQHAISFRKPAKGVIFHSERVSQ
jgi:hypothetical protein